MAAKKDCRKQRSPIIEIVWKDNVPEATYFNRDGYRIVAKVEKGQYILTRVGWDEDPEKGESLIVSANDTLIKALGKRFAAAQDHSDRSGNAKRRPGHPRHPVFPDDEYRAPDLRLFRPQGEVGVSCSGP